MNPEPIDQPEEDPIVAEVRRVREQILASYNYDLAALIEDSRHRTEEAARAGRTVLSPNPATRPDSPPNPAKKVG